MHLLFFPYTYEKSTLIQIQTNDNLIILTHKIDTLIALTSFLKKCEKYKGYLHTRIQMRVFDGIRKN